MKILIGFEKFKDDFLTQLESLKYSYASLETYSSALNKFIRFLTAENVERVQDVTAETIDKYRLSLMKAHFKASGTEVRLRTVRLFFRYLEEEGIIFDNPTAGMRIPKAGRPLQYVPTVKEMDKFLKFDTSTPAQLRNKAMFETAYSCGARCNELKTVDLEDCDLENGVLKLNGKGDKERLVPIGQHAVYWLKKYIAEGRTQQIRNENITALFLSKEGKRIHRVGIRKQVEFRKKKTGIPVTMHSIRRACATHLLQGGANPVEIQLLLGHANLSSLSQYLKVTITELKETHKKSLTR